MMVLVQGGTLNTIGARVDHSSALIHVSGSADTLQSAVPELVLSYQGDELGKH